MFFFFKTKYLFKLPCSGNVLKVIDAMVISRARGVRKMMSIVFMVDSNS
jgi:hypothetical protein